MPNFPSAKYIQGQDSIRAEAQSVINKSLHITKTIFSSFLRASVILSELQTINIVFRTKKTLLPEALSRSASKQLTLQDWSYFGSKGEQTVM